ncbi:ribose-5-phosphate isomerase RpiA [Nannocystis sp. ILAH1]|uniref:ribose-5-phosphate isomerase RpiA n=1 Tax=unclassified Nannocystis TaxID=2627009 RepID=UPI00226E641E|nr:MULTISPECIES: ribose-5-phosphate isomerase RpiA [unclassified Nannocystis]MCY0994528.1 ribose-5-phosphate isomerase RpiA [Nannocystis sp. ILAH1]MCY1063615.1 ribose-5-phosphate isomerase RpiA [Nannocystis sp. RBIL2]
MLDAKQRAASAALELVPEGTVIGVGTGSTVAHFIDGLPATRIAGAVASSEQTAARLRARGIVVLDLNTTGPLPLYVDGADACDPQRRLVKGGGAALTREKIVAAASERFVCIIDPGKRVPRLGGSPLPVEVVPMARELVARTIAAMTGGTPVWREGVVTDNGGWIVDVHGLVIDEPEALEAALNQIAGVVSVGLFARRPADLVIVGDDPPWSW